MPLLESAVAAFILSRDPKMTEKPKVQSSFSNTKKVSPMDTKLFVAPKLENSTDGRNDQPNKKINQHNPNQKGESKKEEEKKEDKPQILLIPSLNRFIVKTIEQKHPNVIQNVTEMPRHFKKPRQPIPQIMEPKSWMLSDRYGIVWYGPTKECVEQWVSKRNVSYTYTYQLTVPWPTRCPGGSCSR